MTVRIRQIREVIHWPLDLSKDRQRLEATHGALLHVREKLLKQRERSMSPDPDGVPKCAYRGEDGRRCAVGHLIPDEEYSPELEGGTVEEIFTRDLRGSGGGALACPSLRKYSPTFLSVLQRIHDWKLQPAEWAIAFRILEDLHWPEKIDADLERLHAEAWAHGDLKQADLCAAALRGDRDARDACLNILSENDFRKFSPSESE